MTMPRLPKVPAAETTLLGEGGLLQGLFCRARRARVAGAQQVDRR